MELDHFILPVNDRARSVAFYTDIVGLVSEGERGPFAILRVAPSLVIQVAAWGTGGGMHFALALPRAAFEATFARIKAAGVAYGDRFDGVGNMQGPGEEPAARGPGQAVYFFDPDRHLLEIRYYPGDG